MSGVQRTILVLGALVMASQLVFPPAHTEETVYANVVRHGASEDEARRIRGDVDRGARIVSQEALLRHSLFIVIMTGVSVLLLHKPNVLQSLTLLTFGIVFGWMGLQGYTEDHITWAQLVSGLVLVVVALKTLSGRKKVVHSA